MVVLNQSKLIVDEASTLKCGDDAIKYIEKTAQAGKYD